MAVRNRYTACAFDTKILPILTYGAEIWCNHEGKDVEKVHHDFCKYVLKVSRLTPNVFVRGELGRYTIDAIRTEILVKYWLKLLHMPNERLPKIYLTKFPTHLVRFLKIFQKRIDRKCSNSLHDKIHHFEILR